jgi:hypothetical protein
MAITAIQKVLTLDYWKQADKLKVGDYVFNQDGKIVQVKLVQHYFANQCYEVTFDDYLTIEGDTNLGFLIQDRNHRKQLDAYKNVRPFMRKLKFIKLKDLIDEPLKDKRSRTKYSIPTTKPIEFPYQALSIPPFIFGFWLYNKNSKYNLVTIPGYQDFIYEKFRSYGYKIIEGPKRKNGKRVFKTEPAIHLQFAPNIPSRIPTNYLFASVEERIELLTGIMHAKSDQYDKKTDRFRFSSRNLNVVIQIQSLVESLGAKTTINFNPGRNTYTMYFKFRIKIMDIQNSPPVKVYLGRRYIKQITPIQSQMCVHIETTGNDNSILVGEGFISTC